MISTYRGSKEKPPLKKLPNELEKKLMTIKDLDEETETSQEEYEER